jgi:hypothetical protein
MDEVKSAAWPLFFTYKGPVFGNGFLSYVELCGRVLAVQETEGVWLNGVNPGAFAVGATTLETANQALREALAKVFIDFAETTDSFESFKTMVEGYYHATDPETVGEWERAVKAVAEGLMPVPEGLPRKPGWKCFLRVSQKSIEQITPGDNPPVVFDRQLAAAA